MNKTGEKHKPIRILNQIDERIRKPDRRTIIQSRRKTDRSPKASKSKPEHHHQKQTLTVNILPNRGLTPNRNENHQENHLNEDHSRITGKHDTNRNTTSNRSNNIPPIS